MTKKFSPAELAWQRNNIDFLSSTIPRATICALHVHIENTSSEADQYRSEIDRLRALVDEKARDERRLFEASERLQDNVIQLQRELNEAREQPEAKKVVLPRKVAEAIDECRRQDAAWNVTVGQNFALLDNVNQALRVKHGSKFINTIAAWIIDDRSRRDVLISALVNGYTVEEPPTTEDKLRERFKGQLDHYEIKAVIDNVTLAAVLAHEVCEVLAEDRQEV